MVQVPRSQNHLLNDLKATIDKEGIKELEVNKQSKKRTLSANAYAWVLINKIAVKMRSTPDEVYLKLLFDYGTREHMSVPKEALKLLKRAYKIVKFKDQVYQHNGMDYVDTLCIRGSSTYDTIEMTRLIDGIVYESKELGIETMTPSELKEMMASYKEG